MSEKKSSQLNYTLDYYHEIFDDDEKTLREYVKMLCIDLKLILDAIVGAVGHKDPHQLKKGLHKLEPIALQLEFESLIKLINLLKITEIDSDNTWKLLEDLESTLEEFITDVSSN